MRKFLIVVILFFAGANLFAQADGISLYHEYYNDYLRYTDTSGRIHTPIRPLILNDYYIKSLSTQSLFATYVDKDSKWILFQRTKFQWEVMPMLQAGLNLYEESLGNRTEMGVGTFQRINIGKNIVLYGHMMFNNKGFDSLQDAFIDTTEMIPGSGKFLSESGNRRSYFSGKGGIAWRTASWFHIFAGYDKVFLGDGVRSLFLSDNSNPFWQVRATVVTKRISYVMLYSFLTDDDNEIPGIKYEVKYSSTHFLNWNIGKRLQLNLFESVVWRGGDSLSRRGFDVNYLSPIVFFRPVEFNLGSPDNMLLGMGGRLRLFKYLHLYGQFVFDEFKLSEIKAKSGWWANKFGVQAGIRTSIPLKENKILVLQTELNGTRPFTYSHWNTLQNYGQSMQPMAHPLGANYFEGIALGKYHVKRMCYAFKILYAEWGTDSGGVNMGQNIYQSYSVSRKDYGNTWLQGDPHKRLMLEVKVSRMLNLRWNMNAEMGLRYNKYSSSTMNISEVLFTGGIVNRF